MTTPPARIPIRFEPWYAALSSLLLLLPRDSYVEVRGEYVEVRMGWAFRAAFPRAAVHAVRCYDGAPLSRGVHGFAGRWLVNGSGEDIVSIELAPRQRAKVLGIGVSLEQLLVSVEEPQRLIELLLRV